MTANKPTEVESGSFYRITREPALGLYRMKCKGTLPKGSLALAGKRCRAAAEKDAFGCLLDFRNCEITVSLSSAHQWFKTYYNEDELHLRFVRTAHIFDQENEELMQFVELAWRNQGILTRGFQDEDEAIKWLRNGTA